MSEAPLPRSWTSSRAPTSKRRRQGNMQCSKRAVAGLKSRVWSRAKQQQLRHASSPASDGSSSGSTTESMGSGFYITIAAIPASIALFKLSHQGEDSQPYLTRLLDNTYEEYRTKWARRNDLHTSAIEEAAADRALFLDESNRAPRRVDVRFPEQLNGGSPWNVPAGQGSANIDGVIAKYRKEAYEAEERKLRLLRENKVPCEQAVDPLVKLTPGSAQ